MHKALEWKFYNESIDQENIFHIYFLNFDHEKLVDVLHHILFMHDFLNYFAINILPRKVEQMKHIIFL